MNAIDAIDPVTLVVVQNGLQQVASEMDLTFERAAFSPVISEGFDRSDGIYSRENGEVIAQGELGLPIFVGVMQFTTRAVIDHVKAAAEPLRPGDIFIVNDPYCGGTHLMDVKMVKPYFYRGQLWAYLSNTGHWPDTGGSVPGGFSTRATEVQQEGLRLPPVKLFREGVMQPDILSIILANIRVPEERIGDIKAQVAALTVGEKRLTALLDRYGAATVTACIAELRRRSDLHDAGAHRQDPGRRLLGRGLRGLGRRGPRPAGHPPPAAEGRHGSALRLLGVERAVPRAAEQRDRHHQGRGVPGRQARLPGRADQRGLLRAPAHRGSARDLPLRPLPAAGLGLRRRGELAHRGVGVHDAGPGHPRRPLRRARRHERQPHARAATTR